MLMRYVFQAPPEMAGLSTAFVQPVFSKSAFSVVEVWRFRNLVGATLMPADIRSLK